MEKVPLGLLLLGDDIPTRDLVSAVDHRHRHDASLVCGLPPGSLRRVEQGRLLGLSHYRV